MKNNIQSIELLMIVSLSLTIILLAGCLIVGAEQYIEAPLLEEKVEKGEIPSVTERLPEKPFVIGPGVLTSLEDLPDWTSGDYGGELRFGQTSPSFAANAFIMCNEPLLSIPWASFDTIRGNVIEDFKVSDDNKTFTFFMREGLKWSDGYPVTTEDVEFAYKDVLLNEELTPAFPQKFKAGNQAQGEPMKLKVIDDYTFQISFNEEYGGFIWFLTNLRGWNSYTDLIKPKHYLKQYHADYTPIEDMREELLEEELEEDDWLELFEIKDVANWDMTTAEAIGFPNLQPWQLTKAEGGELVFERNPYYFKVDDEGKQLPYINTLRSSYVSEINMLTMKMISGEIDFLGAASDMNLAPVLRGNEEKGDYTTILLKAREGNSLGCLSFNYTFEDESWRKVVRDLRFRQAVAHAIDYEEIIETVFKGYASLPQVNPSEYNIEKANQLLDEMDLNERDEEGFRLGPDNEPVNLIIEVGDYYSSIIPITELVTEYLQEVGIKARLKKVSTELRSQNINANRLQATQEPRNWGEGGQFDYAFYLSQLWEQWYNTNGEEGEEPPAWVKKGYELNDKTLLPVPGSEDYENLLNEFKTWHLENVPAINLCVDAQTPRPVSNRVGNVVSSGVEHIVRVNGEQLFIKK